MLENQDSDEPSSISDRFSDELLLELHCQQLKLRKAYLDHKRRFFNDEMPKPTPELLKVTERINEILGLIWGAKNELIAQLDELRASDTFVFEYAMSTRGIELHAKISYPPKKINDYESWSLGITGNQWGATMNTVGQWQPERRELFERTLRLARILYPGRTIN